MQENGPRLFRSATIQSGAVGTLGPIPLQEAAANVHKLCAHLGSNIKGLAELPAYSLLSAASELNMHVFPLVKDGLTIKSAIARRYAVHLKRKGQDPVDASQEARRGPMRVLIGDAEVEVRVIRSHPHVPEADPFSRQAYGMNKSAKSTAMSRSRTR